MTATHWERPDDMEFLRRIGALRAMAGRGRHRGPGGRGGPFFRGPWMGPLGEGLGRRKARRGDLRTAVLLLLAEEPRNGYQIMQELEERSEGLWRPSPGSVYPTLQQLEDEGMIRSDEQDGRRLYHLTDAGRAFVADRPEDQPPPWETFADTFSDQHAEFGALMRDVAMAFVQVQHAGTEAQVAEARRVLTDARRALYRILAEDEEHAE